MARGIELDWVVVRVHTLRKLAAVAALGVLAAAAVFFAYLRLNQPPEARARQAIERAETARDRAAAQVGSEGRQRELEEASQQLAEARRAYTSESWTDAERLADDARGRFRLLLGAPGDELVGVGQVFSLEGRIQVQRAGQGDWESARQGMPLFNGDFVKAGRDGTAEIMFTDGTLYRIGPSSLLEIHHRGTRSKDGQGRVKMVVGRINVYTSTSSSTVTTDSSETEIQRDSRIAVDVEEDDSGETRIAAYEGSAMVRSARGGSVRLGAREVVATSAEGLGSKARLPDPPTPAAPENNAAYDLDRDRVIELAWRPARRSTATHLQVARSKRFVDDELDVDAAELEGTSARLRPLQAGTYFWRLAAVAESGVRSDWSSVRRFRIYSATRQPLMEDRIPPDLEVQKPQQLGNLFILEGRTEPGATVTINGETVEPDGEGYFRKAVEFRTDGWNDLVVVAVDPSGNPTEHRERVYVEVY